eukprot:1159899-Pelagomonas_calceolata.AAC.4
MRGAAHTGSGTHKRRRTELGSLSLTHAAFFMDGKFCSFLFFSLGMQKQRRAEWEAQRQRQIQETEKAGGKWRPASAAAQHSTAGMGGASVDKQPRPHTAAIMQRQGSGLQRQASFGLQRQASLGLQRQASGGMQRQASGGLSRWNSGKSAFSRSNR